MALGFRMALIAVNSMMLRWLCPFTLEWRNWQTHGTQKPKRGSPGITHLPNNQTISFQRCGGSRQKTKKRACQTAPKTVECGMADRGIRLLHVYHRSHPGMDAALESVDAGGQSTDLHGVTWHNNSRAGRRNARGRRCQGYLPRSTNTVQRRNESSSKGRHFCKRMIFAAAVRHA